MKTAMGEEHLHLHRLVKNGGFLKGNRYLPEGKNLLSGYVTALRQKSYQMVCKGVVL